jgi:parallel beta-helix repeat protein
MGECLMPRYKISTLRKFGTAIIFATLAVVSSYQTASAITWYVDPTGTDYNQCGAYPSNPCKTIQYVLSGCYGGCSISLAAGTYSTASNGERFPISVTAAINNAIYITGRKGQTETFIDASESGQNVINVSAGIGFSLSGVTVKGGNRGIQLAGGQGYNSIGASISDSAISNNVTGVYASYTFGEITHNNFSGNTSYGIYYNNSTAQINRNSLAFNCTGGIPSYDAAIYLDSSPPVIIKNNLIGWNYGSGIYVSNSSPMIMNNTISINYGGSGVAVFNASNPTIINNIITSNGYIGIHADTLDSSSNTYNDVWANGYADYLGTSGGKGSISRDPRFVSILDAHLLCSSPAINAGTNTVAITDDYDGNPRPVGGTVDMGAYEKQSNLYCPTYLPLIVK